MKTDIQKLVEEYLLDHIKLLYSLNVFEIEKVIMEVFKAYKRGSNIFLCGNGGSASTASHIACDWGKGTLQNYYDEKEKRFKVYSLNDNTALISAFSNDIGFEEIFVQQLKNLIKKNDVVIGLSVSGNSENVLRAIDYANKKKAVTIGFTGEKGSALHDLSQHKISVNKKHFGHVEDIHLWLGHLIRNCLDELKKEDGKQKQNLR